MSELGREEILHVAMLGRLELSEAEIEKYSSELSKILGWVDQLEALDTSQVKPTSHPIPLKNVLREDVIRPSMETEDILANAPRKTVDSYKVPAVLPGTGSA